MEWITTISNKCAYLNIIELYTTPKKIWTVNQYLSIRSIEKNVVQTTFVATNENDIRQ